MMTDSMLQRCWNGPRAVLVLLSALALNVPLAAMAQEPLPTIPVPKLQCGADVKEQVAEALGNVKDASEADKLATEADLYVKYAGCAEDAKLIPARISTSPRVSAAPEYLTWAACTSKR